MDVVVHHLVGTLEALVVGDGVLGAAVLQIVVVLEPVDWHLVEEEEPSGEEGEDVEHEESQAEVGQHDLVLP